MALNKYIGWAQSELEPLLREIQEDNAAGKATIQAGAGDASSQSRVEKSNDQRMNEVLYALFCLDPVTYPAASIRSITQTRACFSGNPVPEATFLE